MTDFVFGTCDEIIKSIFEKLYHNQKNILISKHNLSHKYCFYAISANGQIRWIIPQLYRLGLPTLHQWRPYGKLSWVKWKILLGCYRFGFLKYLPSVQSFGISGYCVERGDLFWNDSLFPSVVIYIGTPGATRKAIVTLVNYTTGFPIAIMKIPLGKGGENLISREADILLSLENKKYNLSPKLLHYNTSIRCSFQEFIDGYPIGIKVTEHHYNFLKKLTYSSFSTLKDFAILLLMRLNKLNSIQLNRHSTLKKLLNQINDNTPIKTAFLHGDFTPWNLKLVRSKNLIAVDWEFAELNAPSGLDLVHYLSIINWMTRQHSCAATFKSIIINALKNNKPPLFPLHESFLKQFFYYYLVWYQVLLEENNITNPVGSFYYYIVSEVLNDSL